MLLEFFSFLCQVALLVACYKFRLVAYIATVVIGFLFLATKRNELRSYGRAEEEANIAAGFMGAVLTPIILMLLYVH